MISIEYDDSLNGKTLTEKSEHFDGGSLEITDSDSNVLVAFPFINQYVDDNSWIIIVEKASVQKSGRTRYARLLTYNGSVHARGITVGQMGRFKTPNIILDRERLAEGQMVTLSPIKIKAGGTL